MEKLPLFGIKVLEFQGLAPSVYCGGILADFGAEVIVIGGPANNAFIPVFEPCYTNRGKRKIKLNLKNQIHLKILKENIIRKIDVIIDPFRPGTLEKLGISPEECFKINPRLIFARLSGYGQDSSLRLTPGHDLKLFSTIR